ncbi:PQQ-binding-like beta-propeller repeat protein [Maribellus comscasis]|nr:PQQ-binding-like beta-propeller repeat protein [Maribellus comscasis]
MKNQIKLFIISLILFSSGVQALAQKISEWRPENRTGVSAETGLLKSWPAEGPKLLWENLELTKGNSSPSFGNNKVYITGTEDGIDILYALDMNGKMLWQKAMGRAWNESFPESRATPTIEGNRVYTCSGIGDLACFDGNTGEKIWAYQASEENKGTYGNWGIAESLIIDGEKLYFSPGGPETNTIALNKTTGEIIWKSESIDDKPGYVSPILVQYAGKKMLINVSLDHVYGVDISNGDILWKVGHVNPREGRDNILCVTPLFKDGKVYVTAGYNIGSYQIKIAGDANSAEIVWTDDVLDVHHGGVVLVDGYIYGSNWLNNANGNWCCLEWETGKKMWEEPWNCKGSVIAAEGILYIYDEKRGNVGLVKATPEKFDLVSSFKIEQGNNGPFWAHPVIHNGILYIRHTNALMAYDIKEK